MSTRAMPLLSERPLGWALFWMAALGPFFFLSYGFANWHASHRAEVGSVVFAWERHIPFLPWTIVPYWSIDLLYALSLFLCRTKDELSTHVKRLITAQCISVVAFLLFPLHFSFERPPMDGLFGEMFEALQGFDKPFNQAPSLHLSLACIVGAKYAGLTQGALRQLVVAWFVLIGISTLTTYQHHFFDLPTGVWVGLLCLALFPDKRVATAHSEPAPILAAAYLLGAVVCGLLACALGSVFWLLLWPAGALTVVACAYCTGNPTLYAKSGGRIPLASWLLLGPYLLGARVNAWLWTRTSEAAQEVAPQIWIGCAPSAEQARRFRSVLDLTAELAVPAESCEYRSVPMLDLATPSAEQIENAAKAMEDLSNFRPTLVCCALGRSRSAAVVAAWLLRERSALTVDEAVQLIRQRRPEIVIGTQHRLKLQEWLRG